MFHCIYSVLDFTFKSQIHFGGYIVVDKKGKVKKAVYPDNVDSTMVILIEPELKDATRVHNALTKLSKDGLEDVAVGSIFADPKALDIVSKKNKDTDFVIMAVVRIPWFLPLFYLHYPSQSIQTRI